jgi:hypothetical protein
MNELYWTADELRAEVDCGLMTKGEALDILDRQNLTFDYERQLWVTNESQAIDCLDYTE